MLASAGWGSNPYRCEFYNIGGWTRTSDDLRIREVLYQLNYTNKYFLFITYILYYIFFIKSNDFIRGARGNATYLFYPSKPIGRVKPLLSERRLY